MSGEDLVRGQTISEALYEEARTEDGGIDRRRPLPVMIELNLLHEDGLDAAREKFTHLAEGDRLEVEQIAGYYYSADLSIEQVESLVDLDETLGRSQTSIYMIWPDFAVEPLLDRSVVTVKGDAAQRAYNATGNNITWAVIDSGIDRSHPALSTALETHEKLHRDFTIRHEDDAASSHAACTDGLGHGTHIAGIIAGEMPASSDTKAVVGERVARSETAKQQDDLDERETIRIREATDPHRYRGVAPGTDLISLKVLPDEGSSRVTQVIKALEYVRLKLNGDGKLLKVHGVNMSLGYPFNAKWFACGQSPLCAEVDKLVRSGVVVVVAAGNTGYGALAARAGRTDSGLALTINDPGNAEQAITVGSAHRDRPHTFGVSYFSSKGPTGDGRIKPDLVAPGERITSAAAGKERAALEGIPDDAVGFIDATGTSQAAAHVSGVIAAFLSIRREFIGQPEEVKRIFMDTATSLGRDQYFQGRGLIDLMRAIQSV